MAAVKGELCRAYIYIYTFNIHIYMYILFFLNTYMIQKYIIYYCMVSIVYRVRILYTLKL